MCSFFEDKQFSEDIRISGAGRIRAHVVTFIDLRGNRMAQGKANAFVVRLAVLVALGCPHLQLLADTSRPQPTGDMPQKTGATHAGTVPTTTPGGSHPSLVISPPFPAAQGQPKLIAHDVLGAIGAEIFLRATLTTSNGSQAANAEVSFLIGGSVIGKANIGAQGNGELKFRVPPTLKPGAHQFEVRFSGQGSGWSSQPISAYGKLMVLKGMISLLLDPDSTKMTMSSGGFPPLPSNKVLALKGHFSGDSNYPGGGRTVTALYRGIKKSAVSDVNGQFFLSFDRPENVVGNPEIVDHVDVNFEGNDFYLAAGTSLDLPYMAPRNPNAPAPFIATTSLVEGYPDTLMLNTRSKVRVKLQRQFNGSPPITGAGFSVIGVLDGKQVGVIGEGITNGSGDGTIELVNACEKVGLGQMKLFATQKVNGTSWSADENFPASISLLATPIQINVSAPTHASPAEKIKVSVEIRRQDNHQPVKDVALEIKVPPNNASQGYGVIATTDNQGKADFSVNILPEMGTGLRTFNVFAHGRCVGSAPMKSFPVTIAAAAGRKPVTIVTTDVLTSFGQKAMLTAAVSTVGDAPVPPELVPQNKPTAPTLITAPNSLPPPPTTVNIPLSGVKVVFKIDGVPVRKADTDSQGRVAVEYPVLTTLNKGTPNPNNLQYATAGTHTLEVEYEGSNENNGYDGAKGVATLKLVKAVTEIEVNYDRNQTPHNLKGKVRVPASTLTGFDAESLFEIHEGVHSPSLLSTGLYGDGEFNLYLDKPLEDGTPIFLEYDGNHGLLASSWQGVVKNGKAKKQ